MDKHKLEVLTRILPLLQEVGREYGFWKDTGERDRVRLANAQEKLLEIIRLVSTVELGPEINGNIARAFCYLKPGQKFDVYQITASVEELVRDNIIAELTGNKE